MNNPIRLNPEIEANDIEELLEPIRAAILLGAKGIPVLLGIDCFAVYVTIEQANRRAHARTDFVGIYDSQEAAESGLREWILEWWHEQDEAPFDIEDDNPEASNYWDAEAEWISDMTDKDIIQFHFDDHGSQKYAIEEVTLQALTPRVKRAPYED